MKLQNTSTGLNFNGLSVLYQIARVLSTGGPLNTCMMEILRILEKLAGMNGGMISLLNVNGDELVVDVAYGISAYLHQKRKCKIGEGITGQVAKTGKAIALPNIEEKSIFLDWARVPKNLDLSYLALLCVPVKIGNKVIGVLSLNKFAEDLHPTLDSELCFLEAVANLIAQIVDQRRKQKKRIFALERENRDLLHILENLGQPKQMIGNSSSMREVYRYIAQVAPSFTTVLIRGETGTGKELVARAIHQKSNITNGPFIAVNCASLSDSLLESELFGHEKGAFTGAYNFRAGKFEAAQNGTLFLDEIGELSHNAQGRLLRAIQEKEFQRIGSIENIRVNFRLITATNRNLEDDVNLGRFREDLFYRLNVFTIVLPPLRKRGADIMLLCDHFIKKHSKLHAKRVERISAPAIEMLSAYHWPGNVRELENVMERAVLICEGNVIEGHDLPQIFHQSNTKHVTGNFRTFENLIASFEKELIINALKDTDGNQTEAAKILKTTKRVIQYKIEKYAIEYRKYRKNTYQKDLP